MKTNLRRILLFAFDPSKKKCVKYLKILYKEYLQFDPMWHFFWEGKVTYLRVSDTKDLNILLRILENHKIKYELDDKQWVDNIQITKLYQESFAHIFHGFSTIALELSTKIWTSPNERVDHIIRVLERIQHCFLNNVAHVEFTLGDMTAKIFNDCGMQVHEPYMLLLSMLRSSFWQGSFTKSLEKNK
jgi:hypothetical protein